MSRKLYLALLLALPAAAGTLAPAARQRNIDSFEYVWKTVRDKHWDPKLNGADWRAVHDQLRPRIEQAASAAAARRVLQDMLGRLKQSHFNIIPAETYEQMQAGPGSREGTAGLDVRLIRGKVLVTSVERDSPAARAGIRPGWEVLVIDGRPLARAMSRVAHAFGKSTLQAAMTRSAVLRQLAGPVDSSLALKLRNGTGKAVKLSVPRVQPRGLRVEFGYLPPLYVWTEWRRIDGSIGYLAFNLFMDVENVMRAAADAVRSCGGCAGFIIDLRGNPGGIGGMAMGLAGWFVEEKGRRLGTMSTRDTAVNFVVFPRPAAFAGPLAILVDGCSGSTAEIFAGGMKDLKRARIFGARTAGAALPSTIEKLPNGDGFQYAFANYVSEGGQPLEGIGVIPDVAVEPTREALLAGHDLALEAAADWIRHRK